MATLQPDVLTQDQQNLANNASKEAGTAGSPWSVSIDQLAPATPINLPTPAPTANPDGLVSGVQAGQKSLADYMSSLTPPATAADTQNQALLDSMAQLTAQDTGQTQAKAQAKIDAGVPTFQKLLTELNGKVNIGNAEYAQLAAREQAQLAGADMIPFQTKQGYADASTAIGRQYLAEKSTKAAEIAMYAAQAQAAAGNLNTALSIAQNSVDAKYAPIEDQLKIREAQLKALEPSLNRQEKLQALAQQRMIEDKKQELADQKERETNVANLLVQNPKAGILPTDTLVIAAQKAATYLAQHPEAGKLQVVGEHTDDMGNKVTTYGFVNEKTGVVTPYNSDSSTGNANLGMTTGNMFGLPTYNTQDNNPGVNRPTRNNNPGNIKASTTTIKYPGVVGIESTPAADGGNFLIFANPQAGIQSIAQLIVNGSSYQNVTAEQAIKKYNGGGSYGAADVGLDPKKNFQEQLKDPAKLQAVATAIATHEGFSATSSNPKSKTALGITGTQAIDATKPGYASDIISGTGLTQAAIDQDAMQFVMTGKMPSLGLSGKGEVAAARMAIQNRGAELNAGGNIAANQTQLKALSSSLTEQTGYFNNVDRALRNAENTFSQITNAFKDAGVNTSDSSFVNAKVNDVNKFFGNNVSALRAFQAGVFELQNEYAQVFSRGGQRNLQNDQHTQDILNGNFSINDLTSIQDELNKTGEIVRNGTQDQVNKIQDQINNIISPGGKKPSQASNSNDPLGIR